MKRRDKVDRVRARLSPWCVALHSGPPSAENEVAYNGYRRVEIQRPNDDGSIEPISIDFPESTGGGGTVTHFAIYDANGVVFEGPVAPNMVVGPGVIPRLKVAQQ